MKIRFKIAVLVLAVVLITTVSIVTVIYIQLGNMQNDVAEELFAIEIKEAEKVVANTNLLIIALRSEVEHRLKYNLKAAHALMNSVGPLRIAQQKRSWSIVNQLDLSTHDVELPRLLLDRLDNTNVANWQSTDVFIHKLSEIIGVTCTLFQRINQGGDMLRVATTVPTMNGRSAVGTFIPAIHPDGSTDPVIRKVLSGDTFIGRAYVVNDWYNTAYMPLYAPDTQQIVGMLYVGERQSEMVALLDTVEKLAVANHGHVFMLERNHSHGPLRMENVHELNEFSRKCISQPALKEIFSNKQLVVATGVQVIIGEQLAHQYPELENVIIAYDYFAPWDWIIGVCYEHKKDNPAYEHLDAMMHRTFTLVAGGAVLCFLVALLIAYRLAAGISRPLELAVTAFKDVGTGNFDFKLECASGYELQQLYSSFNGMLQNLQQLTISRDQLDIEVYARQKAEKELQQMVGNLATIVDAAPMAITVLSAYGVVTLWNSAAERIFGWKAQEVVGSAYPLGSAELEAEFGTLLDLVANGVIIQAKEVRRFHKNGNQLELLLSAAPMYNNQTEDGVIMIHEDISSIKRIQIQLQQREEQYRLLSAEFKAILEGIKDTISVIGSDLSVRWSNHSQQRWEKIVTDYGVDYRSIDKDSPGGHDCPVAACFSTGKIQSAKATSANGIRWGIKVFPQFNAAGDVVSVIEVASDISESIILREEAMRSARLASLGELAAGIAHEINNPNGVIMHSAPILQEMMDSVLPILDSYAQEHGDYILGRMPYSQIRNRLAKLPERIIEGSQRIKFIVDDLKDFVRDEGEEGQKPVDLNQALEAAARLTTNTVKQATSNFSITYADDLPRFVGSLQRIEQVIVNLIMNSCQALPDNSAAIDISTRYDKDKGCIELKIVDQGCGIRDSDITKVTNPFFTTKRKTGGTGLGLSISSRIIREHNGKMYIDSMLNKGTTIIVSLPQAPEGNKA